MTSAHNYHLISIQYSSHKCLPVKSCFEFFRILIMPWLFKDPVVIIKEIITWLFKDTILIMPNQKVKNRLKTKRSNCPKIIFFRVNSELWGCVNFGVKMAHLSRTKFFGTKNYYFLPIGPFHCAKLKKKKKNSSSKSRVMMCNFWAQNNPFTWMKLFLENLLMSRCHT